MKVVAATMFAYALLALCLMFPAAARAADEGETVEQTICRLIDTAAKGEGLPVAFLTRLIWQESRFETDAVSPEGARGIAQFMPGTADARGVVNPFDPEEAIPKAASLLSDLAKQFGNLGLAAAAYNAGSGKVSRYIAGQTELPFQTESYVEIVTGHTAEEWKGPNADKLTPESVFPNGSCEETVAAARAGSGATLITASPFSAPWGVQISGSFNKEAALRAYQHASLVYASILGDVQPMIIGGVLRSRGYRPYYRVRAPAQTRAEASQLCKRLLKAGGDCVVLRSGYL